MDPSEPTSEDDLAALLPDDPETFVRFLVEDYGDKIVACIGLASYDMLDTAEVEDTLQETLLAVWEKVTDPRFDPHAPLRMVFTIAENKARDARRRKFRLRKRVVVESDVTDLVIADMQGSDLSIAWKLADEEQKQRLWEVIPGIVAGLPPRQKMAVVAFVECYAEIRAKDKYRLVAEAMSVITGHPETVAAAKSALRVGLKKVRSALVGMGIEFVKGRDE